MKGKRNQILLLVMVLIIWAGVIFRFFKLKEPTAPSQRIPVKVNSREEKKVSTYVYRLNYADPFLKEGFEPKKAERPTQSNQPPQRPLIIKYLGLVGHTGLLSIDNHTHLVKSGLEVAELSVLKLDAETITLRGQDSTFVVRLGGN